MKLGVASPTEDELDEDEEEKDNDGNEENIVKEKAPSMESLFIIMCEVISSEAYMFRN